eukprot:TRINITY_DN10883_c0_g1_i12.p1 TRINITY_DN10883_c0_g1~~TRINITY_DN10883_c0_g1_i12.p1  ORF type:complete len:337 (+),score=94.25 TRINITY_DN10883_c0_g1_i12:147-1157(+)
MCIRDSINAEYGDSARPPMHTMESRQDHAFSTVVPVDFSTECLLMRGPHRDAVLAAKRQLREHRAELHLAEGQAEQLRLALVTQMRLVEQMRAVVIHAELRLQVGMQQQARFEQQRRVEQAERVQPPPPPSQPAEQVPDRPAVGSRPQQKQPGKICNPVSEEHLNPRLRVAVPPDKKPVATQVNQSQMLWHKYGEKIVRNRKAEDGRAQLQRTYYKCYKRDCPVRLTVDVDTATQEVVKTSSSGVHDHFFELAGDLCNVDQPDADWQREGQELVLGEDGTLREVLPPQAGDVRHRDEAAREEPGGAGEEACGPAEGGRAKRARVEEAAPERKTEPE